MRHMAPLSLIFALTIQGCATERTVSKTADSRPCITNLSSEGSFLSSRTFRTYQDFSDVTKDRAFNQIVPALASGGWTIASSSKETGVITSWAKPNYADGQTESLNAVVRDKGATGIRVELTYIAPAMSFVPEDSLHNQLCKIMVDVKSAKN